MSGTYNPPWKGDLTRGFWDCGHWYDFPEHVLEAQDLDTALKQTKEVVDRIKPDPRLSGHRQMGGAPVITPALMKSFTAKPARLLDYLQALRHVEKQVKISGVTEDLYAELADAHMNFRIDAYDLKELEVDISLTMQRMLLELNRRERKGMFDTGTTTAPSSKIKPLTLDDIKAVGDKLRAAGFTPHKSVFTYEPLPQLDVTFFNNTGLRLYWNKTVPRHGVTLILRTIGGVTVIGQWQGEYGQFFNAWAELPKDEPIQPEMKGSENDYL